jgi:hypothetical protein
MTVESIVDVFVFLAKALAITGIAIVILKVAAELIRDKEEK